MKASFLPRQNLLQNASGVGVPLQLFMKMKQMDKIIDPNEIERLKKLEDTSGGDNTRNKKYSKEQMKNNMSVAGHVVFEKRHLFVCLITLSFKRF